MVELKHLQFATSIHFIGIDPLLVHYWSQFQIIIYKNINKIYSILIDTTRGIVKKIKRTSMNLLSAHIFLYETAVSTEYDPTTSLLNDFGKARYIDNSYIVITMVMVWN